MAKVPIDIELNAKDRAQRVLEKTRLELKRIDEQAETNAAKQKAREIRGLDGGMNLKNIRETLDVLKGGGQLAVFNEFASKMAMASGKAVEMAQALKEGRISAGEMTEELLKQVPMYGKIWETGRNIRKLFFGLEGQELLAQQIKEQTAKIESNQKYLDIDKVLKRAIEDASGKSTGENAFSRITREGSRRLEDLERTGDLGKANAEKQRLNDLLSQQQQTLSRMSHSRVINGRTVTLYQPGYAESLNAVKETTAKITSMDSQIRELRALLVEDATRRSTGELAAAARGSGLDQRVRESVNRILGGVRDSLGFNRNPDAVSPFGFLSNAAGATGGLLSQLFGAAGGGIRDWLGPAGEWFKGGGNKPGLAFGGLPDAFATKTGTGVAQAAERQDRYLQRTAKASEDTATALKKIGDDIGRIWQGMGDLAGALTVGIMPRA